MLTEIILYIGNACAKVTVQKEWKLYLHVYSNGDWEIVDQFNRPVSLAHAKQLYDNHEIQYMNQKFKKLAHWKFNVRKTIDYYLQEVSC